MLHSEHIQTIEIYHKHSEHASILRMSKTWNNFQVGDVLISYYMDHNGKKSTLRHVSDKCPTPKKFQIVYKDKLGMPWLRHIRVAGGLGDKIFAMSFYHSTYVFVVDPIYIDSMLLNFKYDPRQEYKNFKKEQTIDTKQKKDRCIS